MLISKLCWAAEKIVLKIIRGFFNLQKVEHGTHLNSLFLSFFSLLYAFRRAYNIKKQTNTMGKIKRT